MAGHAETPAFQGRSPGSPLDPSSASRRRPLLWLTLALALGILLDDLLQPARPGVGGLCAAAVLLVLGVLASKPGAKWAGRCFLLAGLCVAVVGGIARHALDTRFLSSRDVARRTPPTPALVWLEGTVNEVRRRQGAGRAWWTVEADALGDAPDRLTPACGRVQIGVSLTDGTDGVAEGDRIVLLTRLEAPAAATLPSGFDSARYLERQGVRRVGLLPGEGFRRLGTTAWWRVDLWLRRASGQLARRNERMWGPERAALPNALLLGRRDGIESSDKQAFQRVGTAHLLAISGLHLQLLAAAVWWLLGRMGWSKRRAGGAVICFSVAYMSLAGAQPPVVRAALMIALYLGGHWFYRAADPLSVVAAAALLILMCHPDALFTAGFQLSFLAVLALATLYPTLEAAWRGWRGFPEEWVADPGELRRLRVVRYVRQAFFISFAAWLGTAPAVAWHMGYFSLGAVCMNLIVVPLTGLAMLGGGLALLAGTGWIGLAGLVFPTLLLGFNRWASGFPWMGWEVPRPSVWLVTAYAAVCLCAWWGRGRTAGRVRSAVLLPVAVVALATAGLFREGVPSCRVTVLDVPRGRAALVETPGGEAVMIDCGGEGAGRVLSAYLRKEGHASLALLIVTEDSTDALGGAVELLERVPARRVILPRSAAPSARMGALLAWLGQRDAPYGFADCTERLTGPGDVRWAFCSDASEGQAFPAAGSEALSVQVTFPGTRVLFAPARSESSVRRLLAKADERLQCDVLRLYGERGGRWPLEVEHLIRRSNARTLVAGEGASLPEEGAGLDLAALVRSRGLRLLTPRREGSLRFGENGDERIYAYRGGVWRHLVQ